jgi:hypothetical protein
MLATCCTDSRPAPKEAFPCNGDGEREEWASRMDFDSTFLLLSLIPSGIGLVLFMYGRNAGRSPQVVTGLVFMVYPYFTGGTPALVGVGVLLGGVLYFMIQAGW